MREKTSLIRLNNSSRRAAPPVKRLLLPLHQAGPQSTSRLTHGPLVSKVPNNHLPHQMENQSQSQNSRRHRGNRSGGRNRNRQGNRPPQGGGNRNRNRNRDRSSSRKKVEPSFFQKLLSFLSFGLLGKSKPKAGARTPRKSGVVKGGGNAPAAGHSARSANRPKRNRTEVTSGRLYVGNLDYSTGESELEALFRGVGNVISTEVVTNPRTQQSKGFAFVEMWSTDEAKRAVSVLDDQDFMGRKLIVSGARSDGPHDDAKEETAFAEQS